MLLLHSGNLYSFMKSEIIKTLSGTDRGEEGVLSTHLEFVKKKEVPDK